MEIVEFLTTQREEYIKGFKMLFQRLEDEGQDAFVERIDEQEVEDGDGEMLFSFFRYDILVKSDDEYYEVKVNVNPLVVTPRVRLMHGPVEILLDSFVWNACSIGFLAQALDVTPIKDWYLKWMQPDENRFEKKPTGVIHSVEIVSSENAKEITVDFGSAPVEAVIELFSILAMAGVKTLLIRSGYE